MAYAIEKLKLTGLQRRKRERKEVIKDIPFSPVSVRESTDKFGGNKPIVSRSMNSIFVT